MREYRARLCDGVRLVGVFASAGFVREVMCTMIYCVTTT